MLSSNALGGIFLAISLFLTVASNAWYSLACRYVTPNSAFVTLCHSSCVFVSKCPSSKETSHWINVHPWPVWPHFNLKTSAEILFPNELQSQVQGLGFEYFWERTKFNPQHVILEKNEYPPKWSSTHTKWQYIGVKIKLAMIYSSTTVQWRIKLSNVFKLLKRYSLKLDYPTPQMITQVEDKSFFFKSH